MKSLILLVAVSLFPISNAFGQTKSDDKMYSFETFTVGEGKISFNVAEYEKLENKAIPTGKEDKFEIDLRANEVRVDSSIYDFSEDRSRVMVRIVDLVYEYLLDAANSIGKAGELPPTFTVGDAKIVFAVAKNQIEIDFRTREITSGDKKISFPEGEKKIMMRTVNVLIECVLDVLREIKKEERKIRSFGPNALH